MAIFNIPNALKKRWRKLNAKRMKSDIEYEYPIKVAGIGGKEFFYREGSLHEIMLYHYHGTKFYSYLEPDQFHQGEDREKLDKDDERRDMEVIFLPMLLNDEGDELEVEQVIELYGINPNHVESNSREIENFEVEYWEWVDGVRNEKADWVEEEK